MVMVFSPWENNYSNPDTEFWKVCEQCKLPWGMHPDCLDPACPLLTKHCHQYNIKSRLIEKVIHQ